jgi:hypothetical protein
VYYAVFIGLDASALQAGAGGCWARLAYHAAP